MSWFVDDITATESVIAVCRSRALGAGVDPFEYERLTGRLTSLRDWLGAFAEAGHTHGQRAQEAETAGHVATAIQQWRAAAACAHIANTLPHPDTTAAVDADRYAARAARRLAELSGPVHELTGGQAASFDGELRLPRAPGSDADRPPVAVIVAGLDSGRAEFLDLADALLARGIAVAAIDGPGQGSLADQPPQPAYEQVTSAVIDTLDSLEVTDSARIALVGLSLGGHYAMLGAAADSRVTAVATISGAHPFPAWDEMPAFAVDTLTLRCGSAEKAAQFTNDLNRPELPSTVAQPMLIVSGVADVLPTPEQAQRNADEAGNAELVLIEAGDHLLGNTRWMWLDRTADWIGDNLAHRDPTRRTP